MITKDEKNVVHLIYGGHDIEHRISKTDVAEYIASRYAPFDHKDEFRDKTRDALALLDYAFDLGRMFGYATLFGTKPDFRSFLLAKLEKENPNG